MTMAKFDCFVDCCQKQMNWRQIFDYYLGILVVFWMMVFDYSYYFSLVVSRRSDDNIPHEKDDDDADDETRMI